MARRILFEKIFNEEECSELVFCGPGTKDGTFAMCMGCPSCGEDNQTVLTEEEIDELLEALGKAKADITKRRELDARRKPEGE